MNAPDQISVDDLAPKWNDGAKVLDVREPDEYAQAHIPGAEHLPMGGIMAEHERLPRDEPIYVVCAVGGRSDQVARFLNGQGVDARNVQGGTLAWIQSGHPVESGPATG